MDGSSSTVEQVHRWVLDGMLRGDLQPGEWLRQDELARRIGVSKIPVREALHRLAAGGLLTFERNRGVRVPVLTAEDAEEVYALRLALEPVLLARAIPALSIVDLAAAEYALTGNDPLTAANWAFHRALYRPSGWSRGMAQVEVLFAAVAPYVLLYTQGLAGGGRSADEHKQLLAACRSGDIDEAESTLSAHLAGAADTLVRRLRQDAVAN